MNFFIFSVKHTNGELLKTVLDDFYSPTEPNPLCQISACFSFKRKDKEACILEDKLIIYDILIPLLRNSEVTFEK